jgi:hypothetical protein
MIRYPENAKRLILASALACGLISTGIAASAQTNGGAATNESHSTEKPGNSATGSAPTGRSGQTTNGGAATNTNSQNGTAASSGGSVQANRASGSKFSKKTNGKMKSTSKNQVSNAKGGTVGQSGGR